MPNSRWLGCVSLCAITLASPAYAQSTVQLPEVVVQGDTNTSLVSPGTAGADRELRQTPGAVEVIPDTEFKNAPAQTIKDVVDWTPGVWAQPKWGDDSRLSIRGSGLSRNFHLRSTQLYLDGIPINTSDGYGDFQEIDPSAYRYTEVFKGSNALRYGANSLGGAINFVTPTGRDAPAFEGRLDGGGFGYFRQAVSSGKAFGPFDYFITGSNFTNQGYRDHSDGKGQRLSTNFGYRFNENVETRLYLNFNHIRQRIPGDLTKSVALTSPKTAWTDNVTNDQQRNIDTGRIASKTTFRVGNSTLDVGLFGVDRHLMHPIFQWLDYRYKDYGAYARFMTEGQVSGRRNRLVAGINMLNGKIDALQYVNSGGNKGALTRSVVQKPENYSAYLENSFYVLPTLALVGGLQYLYAVREQEVIFTTSGDVNGRATYSILSPKAGLLWDVDPTWQVYGNISRSGEAPSFGEGTGSTVPFYSIKAQTATTYEIGTRGRRPDYTWDLTAYRSAIKNELLCYTNSFGNCNVTNADRTVHQGLEIGFGVSLLKSLWSPGPDPDRIWLNVAYTLNDFRFDGDAAFGNNKLPGAPPQYVRAEVLYKHPSGFSFGPNIEWAPNEYYVDSANTTTTASYLLWGLRAAYDTKTFSAYVEGRNLTDENYISAVSIIDRATAASRLYSPGNGRAVYAGLRLKL